MMLNIYKVIPLFATPKLVFWLVFSASSILLMNLIYFQQNIVLNITFPQQMIDWYTKLFSVVKIDEIFKAKVFIIIHCKSDQ